MAKTHSAPMPAQVAAFELRPGETILWWRESTHASNPDGYELRVRTANGFEGMHDTYPHIHGRECNE